MNANNKRFVPSSVKLSIAGFTGTFLLLFVIVHMIGNLQILLGPSSLNSYSNFLHGNDERLWLIRFALLVILALHFWSSVFRSVDYGAPVALNEANTQLFFRASHVSEMMIVSGVAILVFLIYHLVHFSVHLGALGFLREEFLVLHEVLPDGSLRRDVYSMQILRFRNPVVSIAYLVGLGFLCVHLTHGITSLLRRLGSRSRISDAASKRWAMAVACLIFLGYATVPLTVLLGLGKDTV